MSIKLFVLLTFIGYAFSGWVKEMQNPGLYQGDMILTPDQMQEVKEGKFGFGSIKDKLWPGGKVPYTISSTLQSNQEFMDELNFSINQYHKYTCIRFSKQQKKTDRNYIHFYPGGGCSSYVGSVGGENKISLSDGCWWRATIMHEIGHSLGFHHEQSRPDRDKHVEILKYNIHKGTEHNFNIEYDIDSRNTPYDYLSMMHYHWNAFGENQQMTIRTLDPRMQYEIGQDVGFSQTDIVQLNRMYACMGSYPTLPPYVAPPDGCHDLGGACGRGAYKGRCTIPSWKTYMHSKCRKSCGLCGTGPQPSGKPITYPPYTQPRTPSKGPGGNCADYVIDCHTLGTHRCNDSSRAWREYMIKYCKKYCNLC